MLPRRGAPPKFAQLYIYDTDNETKNRLNMFERERSDDSGPDKDIVDNLGAMLDDNNELVKAF